MNNDKTEPFKQEPEDFSDGVVARARKALEEAPEMIGQYRVIERLGAGGMGEVFRADQKAPIRRQVAIKLIKLGMDTKQVVARFEAERQALAMMDHPNIAKVFDGGTTADGRPYFVMEYVKGVPFTEYCDSVKLPLRERLNLFIPVCQAVQHAHQKGIVHRDLKPSNILICLYDGRPVPKVIDFGLAKALYQPLTDQTIYTKHGMMVGTPLYMSPEQAEQNNLDIDTRTDIYSLGVILYELLTGSTPLERDQLRTAAYNEVLRLIKEVEPPKPSTRLSGSASLPSVAAQRGIDPKQLSRSLAGDLDWIVMKALDKERSRRYDTAVGFAKDIERYLNDEAVEACPPSAGYRLKKVLNKHKGKVVAASLLLMVLFVGIIGTSWGLVEAEKAKAAAVVSEKKAILALDEVTKEKSEKESAFKSLEKSVQSEQQLRTTAEARLREAEQQSYRFGLQTAYNAISQGELDSARATLEGLPESLRGWEHRWLMAETEPWLTRVKLPDDQQIVATSRTGTFAVVQSDKSPRGPFSIIQSHDGKCISSFMLPEGTTVTRDVLSRSFRKTQINLNGTKCAVAARYEGEDTRGVVLLWDTVEARFTREWENGSGTTISLVYDLINITDNGDQIEVAVDHSNENSGILEFAVICQDEANEYFRLPRGSHIAARGQLFGSEGDTIEFRASTHEPAEIIPIKSVSKDHRRWKDDISFPAASSVCFRVSYRDWLLFDFDSKSSRRVFSEDFDGPFAIYPSGDCIARIKNNILEYFVAGHESRWLAWKSGFMPIGVSRMCCDGDSRRLYVFANDGIFSFPLPGKHELEVLSRMGGEISPNGKYIHERRTFAESLQPFDERLEARDLAGDFSASAIRDLRSLELVDVCRDRFKNFSDSGQAFLSYGFSRNDRSKENSRWHDPSWHGCDPSNALGP